MIIYLTSYRHGSVLMGKEVAGFMKTFIVLAVTAICIGEALALAPDLVKGNQMVASVFEVLDRTTQVMGDAGEELTKVEGAIELKRCQV